MEYKLRRRCDACNDIYIHAIGLGVFLVLLSLFLMYIKENLTALISCLTGGYILTIGMIQHGCKQNRCM